MHALDRSTQHRRMKYDGGTYRYDLCLLCLTIVIVQLPTTRGWNCPPVSGGLEDGVDVRRSCTEKRKYSLQQKLGLVCAVLTEIFVAVQMLTSVDEIVLGESTWGIKAINKKMMGLRTYRK